MRAACAHHSALDRHVEAGLPTCSVDVSLTSCAHRAHAHALERAARLWQLSTSHYAEGTMSGEGESGDAGRVHADPSKARRGMAAITQGMRLLARLV